MGATRVNLHKSIPFGVYSTVIERAPGQTALRHLGRKFAAKETSLSPIYQQCRQPLYIKSDAQLTLRLPTAPHVFVTERVAALIQHLVDTEGLYRYLSTSFGYTFPDSQPNAS